LKLVDIDVYEDIAGEYRIRSVPTLVMLEDEKEVKRLTGAKTVNQIQEWVA